MLERPRQQTREIERLMGQMREANERLIVAAVQALNLSDEAHMRGCAGQEELDDLMRQLRDANERLAAGAAQAHTMAEEARRARRGVSTSVQPAAHLAG